MMKLYPLIEEISYTSADKFGGYKGGEDYEGWYTLMSSMKIYYNFLDDEKVQAYPDFEYQSYLTDRDYSPSFFHIWAFFTQKQVEKMLKEKIKKDKATDDPEKSEKIKGRFLSFKSGKNRMIDRALESWSKPLEIDGKEVNFSDFFIKPAGDDLLSFMEESKRRIRKNIEDKFKKNSNVIRGVKLPKGTLYRAVNTYKEVKEGQIIKASWDEDVKERTAGSMADWGSAGENVLEQHRPSSKPSRLKSVFCFATPEEAMKWTMEDKRIVIAVEPKGKTFKCDMTALEGIVSTMQSAKEYVDCGDISGVEYDDDYKIIFNDDWNGSDEDKQDLINYEEEIEEMAKNYWAGKPVSSSPKWEVLVLGSVEIIKVFDV